MNIWFMLLLMYLISKISIWRRTVYLDADQKVLQLGDQANTEIAKKMIIAVKSCESIYAYSFPLGVLLTALPTRIDNVALQALFMIEIIIGYLNNSAFSIPVILQILTMALQLAFGIILYLPYLIMAHLILWIKRDSLKQLALAEIKKSAKGREIIEEMFGGDCVVRWILKPAFKPEATKKDGCEA